MITGASVDRRIARLAPARLPLSGRTRSVESLVQFLPFLLILVVFWLLIIRPARKRQQAAARIQSELAPGVRIMTGSGLFATVVSVQDDRMVLETAPGVTSTWARAAVARVESGPAPDGDDR
jgi:preprotein translocase subunit YajC